MIGPGQRRPGEQQKGAHAAGRERGYDQHADQQALTDHPCAFSRGVQRHGAKMHAPWSREAEEQGLRDDTAGQEDDHSADEAEPLRCRQLGSCPDQNLSHLVRDLIQLRQDVPQPGAEATQHIVHHLAGRR